MNTKTGFRIREVCGEKIIVAEGKENIDFSNIISMNDSAAYLWNSVEGKEFTIDTIVKLLLDIYDVDEETAACIMAIISDETDIPLDELQFRRIQAL